MNTDVVVVGGGHAGIEAAHAASRLGVQVILVLPNPDKIGLMPCNPAIGGPGKSQLVFELTALGGVMGHLADETAIHTRVLNASKGPAVQSLRVQNERAAYAAAARDLVERAGAIAIVRGEVGALETDATHGNRLVAVQLTDGRRIATRTAVLCTGTFLTGIVWYGKRQREAGRQGEPPARHLSKSLRATGHTLARFKTGTPPRVRAQSVDFSVLNEIPPDQPARSFSGTPGPRATSTSTWITHTTRDTHALIEANLEESAMYAGEIEGRGPRYCPSIEDKVIRFAGKERHILFVEPDGTKTSEVYLQGFSSSMPPELQDGMIRTLPGFERAEIHRYAYAVEYDALDPTSLTLSMMSRAVPGLFSAGQINGTSGYEEAAVQGLVAGVNAVRYVENREPTWPTRDQGYVGVLLDDLVRWGIDEPYRMLTSRNEYRLLHRQDNAAHRLTDMGCSWGLVAAETRDAVRASKERVDQEVDRLHNHYHQGKSGAALLCRPDYSYETVEELLGPSPDRLTDGEKEEVEILVKYSSYIDRNQRHLDERARLANLRLTGIHYPEVPSLSSEGLEELIRARPQTLGAAQRLRGVRDSDVTALLIHVKTKAGTGVSRETS